MSTDIYTKEEQEDAFKRNVSIKVYALVQIMNVIDIATKRGTFNANELSIVGSLYDSINNGVENAMKKSRQELMKKNEPINGS